MEKFFDNFENMATIEKIKILPHKDATEKETAYRLQCFAMYDGGQMYFCSIYDTKENAIKKLKEFSNGTFKKEN